MQKLQTLFFNVENTAETMSIVLFLGFLMGMEGRFLVVQGVKRCEKVQNRNRRQEQANQMNNY